MRRSTRGAHATIGIGYIGRQGASSRRRAGVIPGDRASNVRDRFVNASTEHHGKWTCTTRDTDGEILRTAHASRRRGWRDCADRAGDASVRRRARLAYAAFRIGYIGRQGASARRRAGVTPGD